MSRFQQQSQVVLSKPPDLNNYKRSNSNEVSNSLPDWNKHQVIAGKQELIDQMKSQNNQILQRLKLIVQANNSGRRVMGHYENRNDRHPTVRQKVLMPKETLRIQHKNNANRNSCTSIRSIARLESRESPSKLLNGSKAIQPSFQLMNKHRQTKMHIETENKKILKAIQAAKPSVPMASPNSLQRYLNELFQRGNKISIKQLVRQRQRMIKSKMDTALPSLSATRCLTHKLTQEFQSQRQS